jgi:hypothetical protein
METGTPTRSSDKLVFTHYNKPELSLELCLLKKEGEQLQVSLVCSNGEKETIMAPIEAWLDLANWLHNMDDKEGKDFTFANSTFKLKYGWFEKGEIYYSVFLGKAELYEFDQGGGSNVFRSDRAKAMLAKL